MWRTDHRPRRAAKRLRHWPMLPPAIWKLTHITRHGGSVNCRVLRARPRKGSTHRTPQARRGHCRRNRRNRRNRYCRRYRCRRHRGHRHPPPRTKLGPTASFSVTQPLHLKRHPRRPHENHPPLEPMRLAAPRQRQRYRFVQRDTADLRQHQPTHPRRLVDELGQRRSRARIEP